MVARNLSVQQGARIAQDRFHQGRQASGYPPPQPTTRARAADGEKNKNITGGGGERQILKRLTLHETGATSAIFPAVHMLIECDIPLQDILLGSSLRVRCQAN
ncbi:MAG: hypothetical protein C4311_14700 [Chloroflexota bacterium]